MNLSGENHRKHPGILSGSDSWNLLDLISGPEGLANSEDDISNFCSVVLKFKAGSRLSFSIDTGYGDTESGVCRLADN